MTTQSIAFVAGRSGGHIIPALTLAHQIKENDPQTSIVFFTTTYPIDSAIIKKHGTTITEHVPLSLGSVPFYNVFKIFIFSINLCRAFFKALRVLKKHRPTRVVGTGGYVSIPVCLAARALSIPVHLYDFDAKPGKANRFLAKYASAIHICFEQAKAYLPEQKCHLAAYPIRFSASSKMQSPEQACTELGLHPNKKTIFINGGSQGSVFINACIKEWLELNPHLHSLIQIIHQTGGYDKTDWKMLYAQMEIPALVFNYRPDLAVCYNACDVIIMRAGAGSLFEALFFQKPVITIPLETSQTAHQKDNARALSQRHPNLVTMLTEHEIKQDNMIFFRMLNRYIYDIPGTVPNRSSGINLSA